MLLACGWQKCWGCSSSPGLGEPQETGPPEALKSGLCVLPSPHSRVLQGPSKPRSWWSCPGSLWAPRTWERAAPAHSTGIAASVVHSLSGIQVPGGHEQSFFWDCCKSSPCNLALLPGRRPLLGRALILLDFFPLPLPCFPPTAPRKAK